MGHNIGQYEDQIRAHLGDLGVFQRVSDVPIPAHLQSALATLSNDKPRTARQTFDGDGTVYQFDLTADAGADPWSPGWSSIIAVEYPTGERIPVLLPSSEVLEPADGQSGLVRLMVTTPAAGVGNVAITYSSPWPYPTADGADDPVPDTWFPGVCALAAARMLNGKIAEYARQVSTSVAGELYQRDIEPLRTAKAAAAAIYTEAVLGRPDVPSAPPQIGYDVVEVDVFPHALFH